jgi:hypothetical protein
MARRNLIDEIGVLRNVRRLCLDKTNNEFGMPDIGLGQVGIEGGAARNQL